MRSWPSPAVPAIPGSGPPVRVRDTATGSLVTLRPGPVATMYVCGITPYDATHLGHAATYVTFDVLGRALRDAGHHVRYVQNVTDVDDPLLARAVQDGLDWTQLADRETEVFREDMTALGVLAPDRYLGVVESIGAIVAVVERLVAGGAGYRVPTEDADGDDVYLDVTRQPGFGAVSGLERGEMDQLFAERGGDPERPGKRDALDPLLWRAARAGEPSWHGASLGPGRPGWHVECTTLAVECLGMPFDIQGGGTDLVFPHHEMSAVQGRALTGVETFASAYVHQAMVGLDGEKMSKSRGNLVLVSTLRAEGVDPAAIRLALLAHHYATPWEWQSHQVTDATRRLGLWRAAMSTATAPTAVPVLAQLRSRIADDLDTPGALAAVDAWAADTVTVGGDDPGAPGVVARAVDALLGVRL